MGVRSGGQDGALAQPLTGQNSIFEEKSIFLGVFRQIISFCPPVVNFINVKRACFLYDFFSKAKT
jgi:hypothetical protein